MSSKRILRIASPARRLGAFIISEIPAVVIALFYFIVSIVSRLNAVSYYNNGGSSTVVVSLGMSTVFKVIFFMLVVALIVLKLVLYTKSQTIGHAVLNLQVVSDKTGEPIGFWKMLLREVVVKPASEVVFFIGYIWVLIDDQHRAWHDKILDTVVIDLKASGMLNNDSNSGNINESYGVYSHCETESQESETYRSYPSSAVASGEASNSPEPFDKIGVSQKSCDDADILLEQRGEIFESFETSGEAAQFFADEVETNTSVDVSIDASEDAI